MEPKCRLSAVSARGGKLALYLTMTASWRRGSHTRRRYVAYIRPLARPPAPGDVLLDERTEDADKDAGRP